MSSQNRTQAPEHININTGTAQPKPPRPNSQCGEILAVLQSGQSITHYQAAQMGIMGFNARICELRKAGWPIVCTMKEHTNKYGRTVATGIYTLVSEQAQRA
ncbi:helix-turn-helix domain-containing protein [Neisseria leonii]|uniref:Helix-turn-helix domain-containing protein n=1 Tax=Neisseria leonii TaxID=2995413 RepID=A0A9X4E4C4_9NEIS|nr:helix-turn-helix domain-containing protein [Neisseria sp. 51.81]MDD9328530.1 helix-turn-helix domain-containing protein [Neisseria sp. 51.81]